MKTRRRQSIYSDGSIIPKNAHEKMHKDMTCPTTQQKRGKKVNAHPFEMMMH